MTGRGSYDYDLDRFVFDVRLAGRWHGHVRYVREGGRVTVLAGNSRRLVSGGERP